MRIFFVSTKSRFTDLKASRVHSVFAYPRKVIDRCVLDMKVKSNFCTSMGSAYQLHCQSVSSNKFHFCPIISPNSQKVKMGTKAFHIMTNENITSTGFEFCWDFKLWRINEKKSINLMENELCFCLLVKKTQLIEIGIPEEKQPRNKMKIDI